MRIALDEFLFTSEVKTGIGWNQQYLTDELTARSDIDAVMNAYHHPLKAAPKLKLNSYRKAGVKLREAILMPHYGIAYYLERWGVPYRWFFPARYRREKIDVTLFFNYFVPRCAGTKSAVYVCDVNHMVFPETTRPDIYKWLSKNLPKYCERADRIITISEFSKSEIVRYIGVPKEKISVIPCGINNEIYRPDYSQDEIAQARAHYDIPEEYILYLGTLEPRKNIPMLIDAYNQLVQEENTDLTERDGRKNGIPKLVLAGMKGWSYDEIFEKVKKYGLTDRVIFTGYVEAADAPKLMAGAMFFVFPSIYEGFGMPPLEAMASGTPVIVSDAASLPEVVGDAGLYAKSGDSESLKSAMQAYLSDPDMRVRYRQKGLERAKDFTWDKIADKLVECLKNV